MTEVRGRAPPDPTGAGRADPTRSTLEIPSGGYLLALAVLVGSLVLLGLFWRQSRERELRAAEVVFISESAETVERLRQRLVQTELALRGGVALFGAVARPTPAQWRAYTDALGIARHFPSMLGLGFAPYLTPSGLEQLQIESRASGHGLVQINPRGVRDHYGPILYLQPMTPENARAVGYDMFSQPVRRAAMEAARDSGDVRLSGVVQLVQDGHQPRPGTLLYAPVYRAGDLPATRAARRLSMQGWVYAPLQMQRFVEATLGQRHGDLRFSIHDVTDGSEALLYGDPARRNDASSVFHHQVHADVYGRRWRFDFQSGPEGIAAPRLSALRSNVVLGAVISLLLFGLVLLLARTEARARLLADRMTENYRRSESRFRNAMVYSAIGKALLDGDGRIVEANPALGRIFGRSLDSLAGMQFTGLLEGEDATTQVPMQADSVLRATRTLQRNDGEVRHVQLTFSPIPANPGQDVARLVQVEDVTERERAEARVRALNRTLESRVALRTRELSAANRELESFAYSVSHDLRAPLRAIDGFSRLLVERHSGQLDDSGRDYLDRVRRAAGRMGELIESMLKMSRLSRSELRMADLDVTRIANDVVNDLRDGDPERRVEVRIAPGLRASGDASLVRNLLQNLLENAWKFTLKRDDALIEVGEGPARQDGSREFFVRDNGAGFPAEYADKLFRPFQRLHSQDQFTGHGIGLASVKRIVDRHGGELRAESEEGEGATFWFTLPAKMSER